MVRRDNLAHEQRPHASDTVRVKDVVPDMSSGAVVHLMVLILAIEAVEGGVLISQERSALCNILPDRGLDRRAAKDRCLFFPLRPMNVSSASTS